jgi:hypothetical protein
MGNDNSPDDDKSTADTAAERKLRGSALTGSEQKDAADHIDYEKARDPDTELDLDGEEDNLYNDGLDVEEDSETLFGTRGTSPGIIKP